MQHFDSLSIHCELVGISSANSIKEQRISRSNSD